MKNLLILTLIFITSYITGFSQEYISTKKGGDWYDAKTWKNGNIPDSNSNVVVSGNVVISEPIKCKNLKISKHGIIEFKETQDSLIANISEVLIIDDGKIKIGDKWNIHVNEIKRLNDGKIENLGTISVGM